MKYIIKVASGSYEWSSEKEDEVEVASDFLENHEEQSLALGLLIEVKKDGEDSVYIRTDTVLANIGEYKIASEISHVIEDFIKKNGK